MYNDDRYLGMRAHSRARGTCARARALQRQRNAGNAAAARARALRARATRAPALLARAARRIGSAQFTTKSFLRFDTALFLLLKNEYHLNYTELYLNKFFVIAPKSIYVGHLHDRKW